MVFEGIVVQVIPQKERDLIARLLLREGTLISFYVYGGMGGGKNSKPRKFEPGNLMRVDVKPSRSGHIAQDSLKIASESSILWQAKNVRHHSQGFALACLFLEMILKTALPHQEENTLASQEHAGLFNVLSNGLFYLDQSLEKKLWEWSNHLIIFSAKFLLHLGILPDENECVFCGCELALEASPPLIIEQGGYACKDCLEQAALKVEFLPIRALLSQAVRLRYQDWELMTESHRNVSTKLIEFWCYHYQVKLPDLTSYQLLF
jgi:recombinational DNA repair protein (RecF pathway)